MTDEQCKCAAIGTLGVVDMGDTAATVDHFHQLVERGEPYWWLYAARCESCGTDWLVAQEERQNDVILLRRLTLDKLADIEAGKGWPSDCDQYETLLHLGREAGHTVRWLDPINDSSLEWTVADLARQRPGISVAELATLLDLDEHTTAVIADKAAQKHGLSIARHS